MTYKLSRFGNQMVLTDENNVRKPFKSLEDLCKHINRYGLKDQISGLELLSEFHRELVGYKSNVQIIYAANVPEPPLQGWLFGNKVLIGSMPNDTGFEEVHNSLSASGLTNPKLIE